MGDWNTAALDPGVWYSAVREGGCRFMAAWVKEEEKAFEHRQRETEEADQVEVAPGMTLARLRRFRAALIGPTQGLPIKRLCYCSFIFVVFCSVFVFMRFCFVFMLSLYSAPCIFPRLKPSDFFSQSSLSKHI